MKKYALVATLATSIVSLFAFCGCFGGTGSHGDDVQTFVCGSDGMTATYALPIDNADTIAGLEVVTEFKCLNGDDQISYGAGRAVNGIVTVMCDLNNPSCASESETITFIQR